ncbi:protein RRNAD1 isoform X2 [Carcharodon carcharias]|nr:protein RRNAD1 isoform X2 [Carcharodon carcharias]
MSTLLLEQGPCKGRESVWPLSLLAYRASAHALAFSRQPRGGSPTPPGEGGRPEEFRANGSQSSKLSHHFRRHVKPKKQHEIRRLGAMVKKLCEATGCEHVVDIGSGQGHLSRYLAFGHGLRLTGVEAGEELVTMARRFDKDLLLSLKKEAARKSQSDKRSREILGMEPDRIPLPHHLLGWVDPRAPWEDFLQLLESEGSPEGEGWRAGRPFVLTGLHTCGDLGPAALRHFARCPSALGITAVSCCYMKTTTAGEPASPPGGGASEAGYPMSAWIRGLPAHRLPYKLRELACHALEDYAARLREEGAGLRVHCYRAVLETIIRQLQPSLRRPGVQTSRKTHLLPFEDYARAALQKLGLDAGVQWDASLVQSLLAQERMVVAYFCLNLLLAPVIETLILLDRVLYLKEQSYQCELIPLFDPTFSPRNFVLVAAKVGVRVSDLLCPEEGREV